MLNFLKKKPAEELNESKLLNIYVAVNAKPGHFTKELWELNESEKRKITRTWEYCVRPVCDATTDNKTMYAVGKQLRKLNYAKGPIYAAMVLEEDALGLHVDVDAIATFWLQTAPVIGHHIMLAADDWRFLITQVYHYIPELAESGRHDTITLHVEYAPITRAEREDIEANNARHAATEKAR